VAVVDKACDDGHAESSCSNHAGGACGAKRAEQTKTNNAVLLWQINY
jgi:hypothetical protein